MFYTVYYQAFGIKYGKYGFTSLKEVNRWIDRMFAASDYDKNDFFIITIYCSDGTTRVR